MTKSIAFVILCMVVICAVSEAKPSPQGYASQQTRTTSTTTNNGYGQTRQTEVQNTQTSNTPGGTRTTTYNERTTSYGK